MPSAAETPSLIDDADFMAELDKLESGPLPPEDDALSAYWDQSSRTDAADEGRLAAVMLEPPAPAPAPPVRRTRSAKPVRPVRLEKPVQPQTPGRIDMPFRPKAPARPERRVQPDWPVRPAHVDEIGESTTKAVSLPQPPRVPAAVAALTVVLCLGAGAGSAALVFHERVAQIVVTWKK